MQEVKIGRVKVIIDFNLLYDNYVCTENIFNFLLLYTCVWIYLCLTSHFLFNFLVAPVPRPKIVAIDGSTDQFNVIIGNFSTEYGPLR